MAFLPPNRAESAPSAAARLRGRGSAFNPGNRHDDVHLHLLDETINNDPADPDDAPARLATRILPDTTRTIINRVDSPDLPFHWTINPYRGCEHGCIYCYARPTHEHLGLSCGLDFETTIIAKHEAPILLRRELAARRWTGEPILMSGVTDPYQPVEKRLRLTRMCLEIMAKCRQPVAIITKNHLVTRDLDLLASLHAHNAARVAISLTTLDTRLAKVMEPRASSPADRLRAIRRLADAGIPVMVMTAPIIPALNDQEIPRLLKAARDAGAIRAGWTMLRLPYQVKDLFIEWLERTMPDRAARIIHALQDVRQGSLSDSTYGRRMRGTGERAEQIARTFAVFAKRNQLDRPIAPLSSSAFQRPASTGQLELFGA